VQPLNVTLSSSNRAGLGEPGSILMANFNLRPSEARTVPLLAISIESARKKFGELAVLDSLNMSVQEGTM